MRYLLLFAGDQEAFNTMTTADAQSMYGQIGSWWEKHSRAGTLVGGEQLEPPATASTVRHTAGESYVVDGPFIEAKEHIGGFAVVSVDSLDEALELAHSWPAGGSVEVRRVIERS